MYWITNTVARVERENRNKNWIFFRIEQSRSNWINIDSVDFVLNSYFPAATISHVCSVRNPFCCHIESTARIFVGHRYLHIGVRCMFVTKIDIGDSSGKWTQTPHRIPFHSLSKHTMDAVSCALLLMAQSAQHDASELIIIYPAKCVNSVRQQYQFHWPSLSPLAATSSSSYSYRSRQQFDFIVVPSFGF